MITLTPQAARKVREFAKRDGEEGKALRVLVKGGGCSGYEYGLTFDDPRPDDTVFEVNGVKVIVDQQSYTLLKESEIDFKDSLEGQGFTFKNPNATGGCGCGKSFDA